MTAPTVAECFIRIQSLRNLAWQAFIGKRDKAAAEHAAELLATAQRLVEALAEESRK